MTDRQLTRRRALKITGTSALLGLAGCMGLGDGTGEETATTSKGSPSSPATTANTSTGTATSEEGTTDATGSVDLEGPRHGDDLPADTTPDDGYPPEFQTVPQGLDVDPTSFDTLQRGDYEIRLVPTDVAYYWYARGEARFADARSQTEFDASHVFGSVLSPAGDGKDLPDDPALQWPEDDRIITYCDCPHHLSSLRAASLKSRGYQEVYALDEGFSAWRENQFPMAGSDVGRAPAVRVVDGVVPERHAGETAWAYHTDSNQREATQIGADGSYELHLKFYEVDRQSTVRIETPAYTVTATLAELTGGTIARDGSISAQS
ncbi:rhodanese-like domain-containing protein [Haloarchaeobius sp. HRN-SO-5]|uniref:rhodanese-like domain-containing protein n=1 Tax=Haloarchaeobius sp. HRN-SO-5 TaxID=3446118 RepID=UPI003EBFD3C7